MQSHQLYTPKKQKLIGILVLLLLVVVGIILILIPTITSPAVSNLPITLHSTDEADYSSDTKSMIPKVDLNIIQEIIWDDITNRNDYEKRLVAHIENLARPIPTATNAVINATATPKFNESIEEIIFQEKFAKETAIQELSITVSLSPTSKPSSTGISTRTNTSTHTPTNTPTRTPTNTPTHIPTKAPTRTPTNTPTNTPTRTPTNTPTHTPTKTLTITPSQTPLPCAGGGTILHELWYNISGETVFDLTSDPRYPDEPDTWSFLNLLEVPSNVENEFGQRVHGYVCAPYTGQYTFFIAGDDNSELWLSTNSNPDDATMIANVPGWTAPRVWDKYPDDQQSMIINLITGQWYYISALAKESIGDDNLAVGWIGPDELSFTTPVVIDGQYLRPAATSSSIPTPTSTNTPTSTPTTTPTPTPTNTQTNTAVPGCSDPLSVDGVLPDGYVVDSNPAPNASNVSTSISTITIFYNQAMLDQHSVGGVRNMGNYHLRTAVSGDDVELLSISYDSGYFSVTITFNNSDANWLHDKEYEIWIKKGLENSCETDQDEDVYIYFTTGP